MKLVTVSEAKTNLSALIEAAEAGDQVVIMRGSTPAVTLFPVTEKDLHYHPEIPPHALASFETEIASDRKEGRLSRLGTAGAAAKTLRKK